MSNTTTPAVRRKLAPEPSATTVTDTKESVASTEVVEDAQANNGAFQSEDASEFNPSANSQIVQFRGDVREHQSMLAQLVSDTWTLPLSKETVFALGELTASYGIVLKLLQRDITDSQE